MPDFVVRDDLYRSIDRKMVEIKNRMGKPGTTRMNPYALERELQRLVERRFIPHNVFVPDWAQIMTVRDWNSKRKWGLPKKAFDDLPKPPVFSRDLGQERRLVLVPYLESVERTFTELWAVLAGEFRDERNWVDLEKLELSLLPGARHPKEPMLRWEVIELRGHTYLQFDPVDLRKVRKPSESPHAGILAAAAHMPEYIAGSSGVWLPGYRIRTKGKRNWDELPFLSRELYTNGVGVEPHPLDSKFTNVAVPTFVPEDMMRDCGDEWMPE